MKLNNRERILGAITVAVLVAAGTWMWAEPRLQQIEELQKEKRNYRQIVNRAQQLLSREQAWQSRLSKLRKQLPRYGPSEKVTAEIMKMLEERAGKAGLSLLKASPEDEKRVGTLYEITINYRWEGELTALVRFLYDLQSNNVNMDISQLSATPASSWEKDQELKGNFSVDVAYTRSDPARKKGDSNTALNSDDNATDDT